MPYYKAYLTEGQGGKQKKQELFHACKDKERTTGIDNQNDAKNIRLFQINMSYCRQTRMLSYALCFSVCRLRRKLGDYKYIGELLKPADIGFDGTMDVGLGRMPLRNFVLSYWQDLVKTRRYSEVDQLSTWYARRDSNPRPTA